MADKDVSRRIGQIYRKYDLNGDGSLDRDQFKELMNQILKDQGRTVSED